MGVKLFKWAFSFLAYRSSYKAFRAKQMKTNGFSKKSFYVFLNRKFKPATRYLVFTKHREVLGSNKTHIYRYTEYSIGNLFFFTYVYEVLDVVLRFFPLQCDLEIAFQIGMGSIYFTNFYLICKVNQSFRTEI